MADSTYSLDLPLPAFATRGRDNAMEWHVYDKTTGAEVAPSAGTISVFNASGVAVVDEAALTVASGYAEYTVLAAIVPTTESLSEFWQVRWTLTLDGVTHTFPQSAHLVRWELSNPVSVANVTARHVELATLLTTAQAQGHVTRAWEWVLRQLLQQGRLPWRILDAYALFDVAVFAGTAAAFLDLHSSVTGDGKYLELFEMYERKRDEAFGKVRVTYDQDNDSKPDAGEDGTAAQAAVFLGGPGRFAI